MEHRRPLTDFEKKMIVRGFIMYPIILVDLWPKLKSNEKSVLDFIVRKTMGFGKQEDAIALSQFTTKTPVKSANTVRECLESLENKKLIKVFKPGKGLTNRITLLFPPVDSQNLIRPKELTMSESSSSYAIPDKTLSRNDTTIDINKKIIYEKIYSFFKEDLGTIENIRGRTWLVVHYFSRLSVEQVLSILKEFRDQTENIDHAKTMDQFLAWLKTIKHYRT